VRAPKRLPKSHRRPPGPQEDRPVPRPAKFPAPEVEQEVARLAELRIQKMDPPELGQEAGHHIRKVGPEVAHTPGAVHTAPEAAVRKVLVEAVVRTDRAVRTDPAVRRVDHRVAHREKAVHRGLTADPTAPEHQRWGRLPGVQRGPVGEAVLPEAHPTDPRTAAAVAEAVLAIHFHTDYHQALVEPLVDLDPAVELQTGCHRMIVPVAEALLGQVYQEEEAHHNHHRMDSALVVVVAAAAGLRKG